MTTKPIKHQSISILDETISLNSKISAAKVNAQSWDDTELWREFKLGNENAFQAMYEQHALQLYQYGLKLINKPDFVKDNIQDLFINLWNKKHRLGNIQMIRPYLYKSLRRRLISTFAKNRYAGLDNDEKQLIIPSYELRLIEKQIFDQRLEHLKQAMQKLTPKQKEIVHLKYYGKLSYSEIAEIMSLTPKAVYKLMGRAIKFLRQNIALPIFLLFFI